MSCQRASSMAGHGYRVNKTMSSPLAWGSEPWTAAQGWVLGISHLLCPSSEGSRPRGQGCPKSPRLFMVEQERRGCPGSYFTKGSGSPRGKGKGCGQPMSFPGNDTLTVLRTHPLMRGVTLSHPHACEEGPQSHFG